MIISTTNWLLADNFKNRLPHTFKSLQKLVKAMADYQKKKNKKTLFGKDKGVAAYENFEEALKGTLLAMVMDSVVTRGADAKEYREKLVDLIGDFADVFPNWKDAYSFAGNYFIQNPEKSEKVIQKLLPS